MVRFGSLSDLAVKASRPEFFTLDIGTTSESQPANLAHHHLKGVKIKIKKGITPRFAMNDLHNFATFTVPREKEKAKFNAVQNYRKQLGSSNFDGNLETAYGKRITAGQHIPKIEAPTNQEVQLYEMSTQTSSTLQMFGMSKSEGSSVFDRYAPEYASAFTKRMKSTFANIVEPEEIKTLVNSLFPSGFIKNNRYRDYDILENLNRFYRNEPEQTGIVQRAYDASSGVAGKKLFPQLEAVEKEPEQEQEREPEPENNEE
jgi:CRISPR/Cas system-associated endoribonuclease Cas2